MAITFPSLFHFSEILGLSILLRVSGKKERRKSPISSRKHIDFLLTSSNQRPPNNYHMFHEIKIRSTEMKLKTDFETKLT